MFYVIEFDYGGQIAATIQADALAVSLEELKRVSRLICEDEWAGDGEGLTISEWHSESDDDLLFGGMGGGERPGYSGIWMHQYLKVQSQRSFLGLMKDTPDHRGWLYQ